jgi:hypothetical protein
MNQRLTGALALVIALIAAFPTLPARAAAPDSTAASAAKPDSTAPKPATPDSMAARHGFTVVPTPADSTLIRLLRQGNRILLFRHASTDWGQRDADVANYADRSAQRNLSAIGRAQADTIGAAVKALRLKIGRVLTSPMYRCRDTAEIAFGHADTTSDLFVKSRASREVRVKWLGTPITDGTLFVQVAHQDPYIPLFRFQRDQLKEADALIIQPLGNDAWRIEAQLTPADWARLAARYGAKKK